MIENNTLFLRLEGLFQAWGGTSKFLIRRSMEAPTKSGVLGLVSCAMGLSRRAAKERLPELNTLAMGVRIDRSGMRWWDYHTVGAGFGMSTAQGGIKTGAKGTLVTRREYLADASFLVALQGNAKLIQEIAVALVSPKWPVFLGRKSCPPLVPVLARPGSGESWVNPSCYENLYSALRAIPWRSRFKDDQMPENGNLRILMEWRSESKEDIAPDNAQVWYDAPVSFDPPVCEARLVVPSIVSIKVGEALQRPFPAMRRPRADYKNGEYRNRREERIEHDAGLCVFCKSAGPRMTVQHITYRRAGGDETLDDLRALCGLCHDAVTMIEYGLGMGLDRINPEEPRWRELIIQKRNEILKFRSLENRRRRLAAEEVE